MVPADFSDWRNIELQNRKRRRCCSVRCLKAPMHMFTFFYWLSGVALVVVGAWTLLFESRYNVLLGSSWFLIIVGLMIGTGGLIMIVCICGCYGIVKEHRYSLISFLILLTLIFIIECSIGVAAFVHRSYGLDLFRWNQTNLQANFTAQNLQAALSDNIEENLDKSALDRMNEYGTSDAVRDSFDDLQQRHMCCGSSSYSTWNNAAWKRMTENQNLSVPDSCCKTITPACGKRDHPSNIYHEGCILKLSEFFREHVFILGFIALVLSAVQLTGIILSSCMIRLVEY